MLELYGADTGLRGEDGWGDFRHSVTLWLNLSVVAWMRFRGSLLCWIIPRGYLRLGLLGGLGECQTYRGMGEFISTCCCAGVVTGSSSGEGAVRGGRLATASAAIFTSLALDRAAAAVISACTAELITASSADFLATRSIALATCRRSLEGPGLLGWI